MHMHVCIYAWSVNFDKCTAEVHMNTYMHTNMDRWIYVCVNINTHTHTHTHTHIYIYIYIYIDGYMHACMCACMYVRMHVCAHACMYVCMTTYINSPATRGLIKEESQVTDVERSQDEVPAFSAALICCIIHIIKRVESTFDFDWHSVCV